MIPPWDSDALMEQARGLDPLTVGVVHPCDAGTISGVLDAAEAGLIVPILIGPTARIMAAAEAAGRSLGAIEIIDVPHSHAAVTAAADLARTHKIAAILRGSLRIEELMEGLVGARSRGTTGGGTGGGTGLRSGRRMSHVFVLDVPGFAKPLLVTDALINIRPDLETKADILHNAIQLAHALGIACPRVAILSAADRIRSRMPATLDAASLSKMAQRGQITGALVDGPMGLDAALSDTAAAAKGVISDVAGNADILMAPDLEAANVITSQLITLSRATAAGLVMGAQVPIILTGPSDPSAARRASCALAQLQVRHASTN